MAKRDGPPSRREPRPLWLTVLAVLFVAASGFMLLRVAAGTVSDAFARQGVNVCRPLGMERAEAMRIQRIADRHGAAFRAEVRAARAAGARQDPAALGHTPNFFTVALARHLMAALVEASASPPVPFSDIPYTSFAVRPWQGMSTEIGALSLDKDLLAYTASRFYRSAGLRYIGGDRTSHALRERGRVFRSDWTNWYYTSFLSGPYPEHGGDYIALSAVSKRFPTSEGPLPRRNKRGGCPEMPRVNENYRFVP